MNALHMRPGALCGYLPDGGYANAEVAGNGFQRFATLSPTPNLSHIAFGNSGKRMLLAFYVAVAMLLLSILIVVLASSQEQVAWVTALAIVALVKHAQSSRNRPSRHLVSDSVGAMAFPRFREDSVARVIAGTSPLPAAARLSDPIPKAKANRRSGYGRVVAAYVSKLLPASNASAAVRLGCKSRPLSATAVAETESERPVHAGTSILHHLSNFGGAVQ